MRMNTLALTALCLSSLVACGDKDDDTGDNTTLEDGGATDGGATDGGTGDGGTSFDCETEAWADQTGETKGIFMSTCVVPVMKPLFQAQDPERFADFSCATCHGDDFGGGTYAMPALWALDWGDMESWPEGYSDFMQGTVVPTMGGILGYDLYDPKTNPEGFGCAACHM